MSREIEIICEEDQPRYFEISEGSISLNMLKSYYPNITGLTYTQCGKSHCLNLKDEAFIVVSNVNTYEVFNRSIYSCEQC